MLEGAPAPPADGKQVITLEKLDAGHAGLCVRNQPMVKSKTYEPTKFADNDGAGGSGCLAGWVQGSGRAWLLIFRLTDWS